MIQESSGTIGLLLELHRHTDKKVKRASYGALWNMRKKLMESERYSQIAKEIFKIEPKMAGDQSVRNLRDGHVMISYQWGYQKLLKRIKECLRKNDINVWMDVDDMQGSTLDAMAKAVEEASIVLICFSQKYKDSDNCRAEAEYAYQLKKTIIPLKMELGYKPDGWLGIMCGTKLFYDFSGKYSFESKITDLVKDIQSQRNRYQTSVAGDTKTSPYIVLESTKPTFESTPDSAAGPSHVIKADENVMKWREEEVQDWVHTNDLPGLSHRVLAKLKKENRSHPLASSISPCDVIATKATMERDSSTITNTLVDGEGWLNYNKHSSRWGGMAQQ
ncbi:hypothetical protein FSP39_016402 [Pinctada imbricata]|uniref:TIR domain-containing protein n=1 Tax=Pinctada imbricata TaxID=66713 RepID=A0AA89C215_PINIB|nr:hypothetical protein FSP39_016402 [Pinctada imbricata]